MNKKLLWIKKNMLSILLFISTTSMLLFGFADRCSINRVDDTINAIQQHKREMFIKDSIESKYEKKIINAIDSVNIIKKNEVAILKDKISKRDRIIGSQKEEIDSMLVDFNSSDTAKHNLSNCEKIVDKQSSLIEEQSKSLLDKSSVILKQDTIIKGDSVKYDLKLKEIARIREMNDACNKESDRLIKELNGTKTWLKRNEKWFYFGGGAVSVGGLLYLLKRSQN